MKEKEVEEVFKNYKKELIKKLGRKALWNNDIDKVCSELFGKQFVGCFPQDKIHMKSGFQVLNVDTSKEKGSHWVAIFITSRTCYVYDSFARPTPKLLKHLTKKLNEKKIKFKDSDRSDAEQRGGEICGQLCVAWLYCVHKLGIKNALKI